MLTKTKKFLNKFLDCVPPGELALILAPLPMAFIYDQAPWYAYFIFSAGMWLMYGIFTYLHGFFLPAKYRFSVRDCATRPLSSFLELLALRIPLAIFEPHFDDELLNPEGR